MTDKNQSASERYGATLCFTLGFGTGMFWVWLNGWAWALCWLGALVVITLVLWAYMMGRRGGSTNE